MSEWGVFDSIRNTADETKSKVKKQTESAMAAAQDASNEMQLNAVAPYVDPMRQAYGQAEDVAKSEHQKWLVAESIRKQQDYLKSATVQDKIKKGYYQMPSTPEALAIGAGETLRKIERGIKENSLYHPLLSAVVDPMPGSLARYAISPPAKEEQYRKLQSLYSEQQSDNDVVNAYLGETQPVSRFIGNQLPYIAPQAGLGVARSGAVGYSKIASTLGENGLKYPALSDLSKFIPQNPYVQIPSVNPLVAATKAFPSTFAKYTGAEAPATIAALDKATPYIDRAVAAVKGSRPYVEARDILNSGKAVSSVSPVSIPVRAGSNGLSRFVDSLANNVFSNSSILGTGLSQGIQGGILGGLDIDQSAGEGAAWGAGTGMAMKALAGAISKPEMDSNPIARRDILNAKALGFTIPPGAYTGHTPTQQLDSAMGSNSAISDQIKSINQQNNNKFNIKMTSIVNPDDPKTKIDSKWLDEQTGVLRRAKDDIVADIGDSQISDSAIDTYLRDRDFYLGRVGGREIEPRTGQVMQVETLPDGQEINYLSPEQQLTNGSTVYDDLTNPQSSTIKILKRFDTMLNSGTMTGEQFRDFDKQIAHRLKSAQITDTEKDLLMSAKNLINDTANDAMGPDAVARFKDIKAREALAYKLYDNRFVDLAGDVKPGSFIRKDAERNNWPDLPQIEDSARAHLRVSPEGWTSANLSSNDLVGKMFGKNPVDSPLMLYGSRFANFAKRNPIGDFIAKQYYKEPFGIPEKTFAPFVSSVPKRVSSFAGSSDYSNRLSDYAKENNLNVDSEGNLIPEKGMLDSAKEMAVKGVDEAKYQGQDLGLLDKDLSYWGTKTERTFNDHLKRLRGNKNAK